MFKAIIFDAYGTLISTGTGSVDAAQKILLKNNRTNISTKEFYAQWKKYHKLHIESQTEFINEEEVFKQDLKALYVDYRIDGNSDEDVKIMLNTLGKRNAFSEAKEVVDNLSKKLIVCIGSTTDTAPLLNDLKRNKIQIDKVYTSENLKTYKPKKEFYQAILDELSLKTNEVLFVGDSLIDDVYGPKQLGIKTCWINRKCAKANNIIPDYEIKSLCELEKI